MAEAIDRRSLLRKGLVLGGVGTAAGVLGSATGAGCATAQEAAAARRLTLDVACLGDTFRMIPAPGNAEGDLRGNTFYVEGWIYPANTIPDKPKNDFDPASEDHIGTWLCRGWFMINADRGNPHVVTTQEYILGNFTKTRFFPEHTLVSSGTEGSDEEAQTPIRSVIGGTGRYVGSTGVVLQHGNGTNKTRIEAFNVNAPNFRFRFSLLLPEGLAENND